MGSNYSKSELTQIVENTIMATVQTQQSASTTGTVTNKVDIDVIENSNVNMLQDMQASITIKATQTTQSVTDFQAKLESEIKKKVEQKSETGSASSNTSISNTTLINKFAVDCSKALSHSLSMIVNATNEIKIGTIRNSTVVKSQFMSVEAMAEQLSQIILSDKAVSETKTSVEELLKQTAEGFAGMLQALVLPLLLVFGILIVGVVVYNYASSKSFGRRR